MQESKQEVTQSVCLVKVAEILLSVSRHLKDIAKMRPKVVPFPHHEYMPI